MKITVQVMERHIKTGVCGNVEKCAVAAAVSDIVKPGVCVHVDGDNLYLAPKGKILKGQEIVNGTDEGVTEIHLPDKIRTFISKFDELNGDGKKMPGEERIKHLKPVSFVANIPSELLRA